MSPDDAVPAGFEDFDLAVRRHRMPVERLVSREVFGSNAPVYGYTTPAQAESLVTHLGLRPRMRLLDIGAGRGWPALQLSKLSGCDSVLSDVPAVGLREAMLRASRERIRALFVRASGTMLPFRPRSFDAIVHTDVL
jgi:cyclopropane fatty-acyl-phospholipid synthase-like methyltransferase